MVFSSTSIPGNGVEFGAGRDDDVLGFDRLALVFAFGDGDLAGRVDMAAALQIGDLVFLEQELDALGQAIDDPGLRVIIAPKSSFGFTTMPWLEKECWAS